jgi:hypothetical protein
MGYSRIGEVSMPLQSRLTRQIGTAIPNVQNDQYAQDRGEGAFNGITDEVIDFVYSDGSYGVSGMHLTTTGVSQPLVVGQVVQVGWRGGVAQAILSHTALRSKYTPPQPNPANGIVEEIFVSNDNIWFRNADQFTQILPNKTGGAGKVPLTSNDLGLTSMSTVHWGKGDASFICVEGAIVLPGPVVQIVWVVIRLNRPKPNEPFPAGFKVRATVVQLYNLSTDPFQFGTFAAVVNPGGHITSAPLKYINATIVQTGTPDTVVITTARAPQPVFQAVCPNGDLLVTIEVTGDATGSGVAQVAFVLGSVLINVTKSVVVENRMASALSTQVFDDQTSGTSPVCTLLGESEITVTTGRAPVDAGQITVLSVLGKKPADTGTFNNYALLGPARFQGEDTRFAPPDVGSIFCYPTRATLILSIVGEFPGVLDSFPGSSSGPTQSFFPRIQGSRTMLLYGTFTENGLSAAPLNIVWLPQRHTSIIAASKSSDAFGFLADFAPFFPQGFIQARSLFVTQASQVYTPREDLPYSFPTTPPIKVILPRPNFIATSLNKGTGVMSIDMRAIKSTLGGRGLIARAKTTAQQAVLTSAPVDLQVIDSRTSLGSAFQSGPL